MFEVVMRINLRLPEGIVRFFEKTSVIPALPADSPTPVRPVNSPTATFGKTCGVFPWRNSSLIVPLQGINWIDASGMYRIDWLYEAESQEKLEYVAEGLEQTGLYRTLELPP